MFAQQVADLVVTHAGHILAYVPTPNPEVPAVTPGDPTAPRSINIGKFLGWMLVGVMFLVVFAGVKVITKTHNGNLAQGFQISLGAVLGVAVIAIGITGVGVAVITNLLN